MTTIGAVNDAGTIQVNSTISDPNLTLTGAVTIAAGGKIEATGSNLATITFSGASVDNSGTIIADQSGSVAFLLATVTNELAGVISAATNGTLSFANSQVTNLSGAMIEADSGGSVSIGQSQVANPGTITAGAGGTIYISNSTISDAGGTISASGPSAQVQLLDATIQGGTLSADSGGAVAVVAATGSNMSVLDGSTDGAITVAGAVGVAGGAQLELMGAIHVNGANGLLDLNAPNGAGNSNLLISGTVTLDTDTPNSNQITLESSVGQTAQIIAASGGGTLNNVNATISGVGQIGQADGLLTLNNEALGTITGSETIETGNTVINAGAIIAATDNTLTILDSINNSGTLNASGGTLIAEGAITGTGSAVISASGTFEIGSTDAQNVTFAGVGTLKLDHLTDLTGSIQGLAAGDVIDLADTVASTVLFNGSTLTVNGQATTFQIASLPSGDTFAFKSDGASGTDLIVVSQTLTVTAGATATFNGGGAAVLLDSALTVADTSSPTLAGATVSISAGFLAGDALNFTNQNGITGSYNATTGVLTLSGTASQANYQTALELITYGFSPSNGDPTGGGSATTRTISWVVNDGAVSSAAVTSTLDTVHVAPAVVAGATVSYEIGGAAVALDSALTVSDADSGGNLAGATVAIGTGFASGDTLHFTNQNGITGSYNATTGVLTLSGAASLSNYQSALDSITFSSTVSTAGARTIDWTVTDGSTSHGTSTTATSTVDLSAGPQVTAGATATFNGGGAAVLLDSALTVADTSSPTLAGATVSISAGFLAGDALNFTNQNGITGSYNATTGVLTLSGTASQANYQTALELITYGFSPSNGDPTGGGSATTRTISWVVNDGAVSSAAVTSTLDTVHVAPAVVAGATVSYEIGGAAVALDSALTVSDADSGGNLAGATVAIGTGFASGDTLHFTNQNGITGSYNATTGVLTLSGAASLSNYQSALDSITFSSTVSTAGARTIDWTVTDGSTSHGTSTTATSTLSVTNEDDWTGATGDGNWTTPGNWSNGVIPNASTTAVLGPAGIYPVTSSGTLTAAELITTSTATLNITGGTFTAGSVSNAGTLTFSNATVTGTSFNDPGTIQVASGTTLALAGSNTISGGLFFVFVGTPQAAPSNSVLFPFVLISDLNPDDPVVTLTIQANGSFAPIADPNLTFGQSGNEFTITGQLNEINNALANGIIYSPASTADTLTLTVADLSGDTAFRTISLDTSNPASPGFTNIGSSGEITNAGLIDITGTTTLNSDQLFNTGATVKVETNDLLKLDGTRFNGGTITDNGTVEIAGPDAIIATNLNIGTGDHLTIDTGGTLFVSGTTISGGIINNLSSAPGIDVLGSSTINGGAQLNGGVVTVTSGQTLTFGNATTSGTTFNDPGIIQVASGKTLTLAGTDAITGSVFSIFVGSVQAAPSNSVLFPFVLISDLNPDDPVVTLTI